MRTYAQSCCHEEGICAESCQTISQTSTTQSIQEINDHTDSEFQAHRTWLISIFWEDNVLPALMLMAEQLTTVAMKQTEMIGGFMDAKHQMETQQVFQELRARAHKDYHPSMEMCEFGTNVKSLVVSERRGEINALALSQRAQDRALGNANTAGAEGKKSDSQSRLKQFRETYCDPKDHNNGLEFLCGTGASNKMRVNKDIDYARTIDSPWTLDVNFTEGTTQTDHEEDVLALAANLYGNEVFFRPGAGYLRDKPNVDISDLQMAYMDARAIRAKRSVAENSYNAIVGMKSAGTAGSRDYLEALLKELGVDDNTANVKRESSTQTQLDALLGENPSYYAQMEVLTKKIYQNPDFYTNLYDKPANVERKGVALQAISLMQKFDLFKSYLRNEASLSILLELAVTDLQEKIENDMVQTRTNGEKAE
ncbi:MAG: hypothetical protein ACPGRX_01010 [Bdellovibrionales bacterium]